MLTDHSLQTRLARTAGIGAPLMLGLAIGIVAGAVPWPPTMLHALQCAPRLRATLCPVASAKRLDITGDDRPGQAIARAIPELVTLDGQVWLQAEGLPVGDPRSLTLLAPDGTTCSIPSEAIGPAPPVPNERDTLQAFVNPAHCANAEGVWAATFTAGDIDATARFLVVDVSNVAANR